MLVLLALLLAPIINDPTVQKVCGIDPATGKCVPVKVGADGTVATSGGGGGGGGGATFTNDGSTAQLGRAQDTDSGAGTHYTPEAILMTPGNGGPVQTGTASSPLRTDPTGATVQPVSATSLPLPTGASQDRTTAAAPFSCRASDGASFYDSRQVRLLTASDVVALGAGSSTIGKVDQGAGGASAWLVTGSGGTFPVTGTFWPTIAGSPLSSRLSDGAAFYDAAKTGQLPSALVSGRLDVNIGASTVLDVSDRAGRLLGVVYGSQGQQVKQTATNFNLQAELAVGGTLIDPRSIRALTVADVVGLGAGSAIVGKVGIDQTTPGTTNAVQDAATSSTGSAVPSKASFFGGGAAGGTGNLTGATVKAASTAPAATDTAVVVTSRDTVTVSGTVTTTPPSNASTNLAQVAGTTTDTNSGLKSAGTLRVVIATDQPQLTNKILVTPDSVALPPNQSVNVAQVNGVTTAMGHGVASTGTQRVFVAQKASYSAANTRTATAAGTGVFFNICGSASTTVRVQYLYLDIQVATAAINSEVVLTKTSAATSGGTATTLTNVPSDSSSSAATAVTKYYTVLGTAGTPVGKVDLASGLFPITASPRTTATAPVVFDYRSRTESETFTLRGTAQCLEAAFAVTTTNAPTIAAEVKWSEE